MKLEPVMKPILNLNHGTVYDMYGGKFVGEFPLTLDGTVVCGLYYQHTIPEIVYQRVKDPKDVSNYFVLYMHPLDGTLYIRNGLDVATRPRTGIITPNGDFIYSRGRHDCVVHDGCMVDGGDSYFRHSATEGARVVDFMVHEGVIYEDTLNRELDEQMDFINKLTYKD